MGNAANGARTMVLVPTYMEAGTICRLIDEVSRHLPEARVVVVDDQAPDGTADVVRSRYVDHPAIRVVTRTGRRGFGRAMRDGVVLFLASDAERLITIDADLSHDPALTVRILLEALIIPSRLRLRGRRSAVHAALSRSAARS